MQGSVTLAVLIWQGLKLGRLIAVRVIEAIILERVQEASPDLHCESCGNRLESKGQLKRQLVTIVGIIEWKRQVKPRLWPKKVHDCEACLSGQASKEQR